MRRWLLVVCVLIAPICIAWVLLQGHSNVMRRTAQLNAYVRGMDAYERFLRTGQLTNARPPGVVIPATNVVLIGNEQHVSLFVLTGSWYGFREGSLLIVTTNGTALWSESGKRPHKIYYSIGKER